MSLTLSLIALTLFSGQGQPPAGKKQANRAGLRCAYIGQNGTFHLIGNGGSAAYEWNGEKFVADLLLTREDANFRYYTPSDGDPDTTEWAFSKVPECGMYWVWRQVNGRFLPAEPTRGWGVGLDRQLTSMGAVANTKTRLDELERKIDDHEGRLKRIEKR